MLPRIILLVLVLPPRLLLVLLPLYGGAPANWWCSRNMVLSPLIWCCSCELLLLPQYGGAPAIWCCSCELLLLPRFGGAPANWWCSRIYGGVPAYMVLLLRIWCYPAKYCSPHQVTVLLSRNEVAHVSWYCSCIMADNGTAPA